MAGRRWEGKVLLLVTHMGANTNFTICSHNATGAGTLGLLPDASPFPTHLMTTASSGAQYTSLPLSCLQSKRLASDPAQDTELTCGALPPLQNLCGKFCATEPHRLARDRCSATGETAGAHRCPGTTVNNVKTTNAIDTWCPVAVNKTQGAF